MVKERIGKDLSITYISDLKRKLREKGREYISLMAKGRDAYVSEYLTLIEGAKKIRGGIVEDCTFYRFLKYGENSSIEN